jgi:hypothetical protein
MQEYELVTTKNEQAFFATLKEEGLSNDEKLQIRKSLQKRMNAKRPSFFQRIAFVWPVVHSKPAFGLAVFGVLALVGVGVGKASEDALPGDILYKTKTVVYEPVSEIFSQKDKKEEVKESIRRRLDEAQALAIQGRFGLEERLQIENLIEEDLQRIDDTEKDSVREEVVLMSGAYSQYFLIVLASDKRLHLQIQLAPLGTTEKEVRYEDEDSLGDDEKENDDEEKDEERHSGAKNENSHESEKEEEEEETETKQVKKSKSGSSNTSGSQSEDEKEEEEEDENEKKSNSGSGSSSHSGEDEEEDDEEEEEE